MIKMGNFIPDNGLTTSIEYYGLSSHVYYGIPVVQEGLSYYAILFNREVNPTIANMSVRVSQSISQSSVVVKDKWLIPVSSSLTF